MSSALSASSSLFQFFKLTVLSLQRRRLQYTSCAPLLLTVAISTGMLAGCASNGMPKVAPSPTKVVVVMTSTANDRLAQFFITIKSISLGDKAGNTVALYSNPNPQGGSTGNAEFMHLNGISEPLVIATVPQGVYTQATVAITSCSFTNVTVNSSGGVVESTYAEGLCGQGTGQTTVNLPAPVTVSGPTMALSLNLQVAQSFTLNANTFPQPTYTISPVFTLTPLTLSLQPSNELNGKFSAIDAQITSINAAANSFATQTADGFALTVNTAAGTNFQGVAGFSTLTVGTLVSMDVTTQPDASLLATRVEVNDLAAPTTSIGPFLVPGSQTNQFVTIPVEAEGCTAVGTPFCGSIFGYDNNTVFGFSGQFSNVQSLPFPAVFSGPGLLLGQNLSVFSSGQLMGQGFELATTVTLSPQVVNGTVMAISNVNNFTVYSVSLALDSLIPTLQATAGTTINRLNAPTNSMEVYVDSNAQLLTSSPIAVGSVLRFRGLVFDDNGTLRMDCNLIRDGVPE
jgi:hypothetical protein